MDAAYRYLFFTRDPTPDDGLMLSSRFYYSFDVGNAHFVVLDPWKTWWEQNTDPAHLPWQQQKAWLENDLATTLQHWKIVINHFPLYCDGNYDSDDNAPLAVLRQELVPIMDRFGVDLFIAGHDHTYQRTYLIKGHTGARETLEPQRHIRSFSSGESEPIEKQLGADAGTVYVVSGAGGGSRPSGEFAHPEMVPLRGAPLGGRGLGIPGSLLLEIRSEDVTCVQVGSDGRELDHFRLRKRR
jgi:acid phosphatase type 7